LRSERSDLGAPRQRRPRRAVGEREVRRLVAQRVGVCAQRELGRVVAELVGDFRAPVIGYFQ